MIDKLKRQYDAAAGAAALLTTLQLLQSEVAAQVTEAPIPSGKVTVVMPAPQWNMNADSILDAYEAENLRSQDEQKVVFELDPFVEEAGSEKELEVEEEEETAAVIALPPMQHTAYLPEKKEEPVVVALPDPIYIPAPAYTPPPIISTPLPSVEAVEMKSPVVETDVKSLNDLLEKPVDEMFVRFQEPIKDLKKAISINDRYQYINSLFSGDESTYDRSIKTINNFNVFSEAEYWIRRELAIKHGWEENDKLVQQFYNLVSRRFS